MYNQIKISRMAQIVDILTDPNVAYLLLASSFLLTLMAFATPGTGILEIGAVLAYLLTGWALFNLPVNFYALGLLLFGVFPLTALFRTRRTIFLLLSILCLELGSAFLFRGEGWQPAVHPLLAIFVSILTAGYYWITAQKILEAEQARPTHDLNKLIGSTGEAKTDIQAEGSVQVDGELWSARSNETIPEGTQVRVAGRDGFILIVEPVHIPPNDERTSLAQKIQENI
jgi:membrane-bound serine protease (ClpP class)